MFYITWGLPLVTVFFLGGIVGFRGWGGFMNLLNLPFLCLACLFEPIWGLKGGGLSQGFSSLFLFSLFVS